MGMFRKIYDYVKCTTPSATKEVYTTRLGGATGVIQEVVTVIYTDSSKNLIETASRRSYGG